MFDRFVISLLTQIEDLQPAQLRGFFVGWPARPDENELLEILRGSDDVVVAFDDAEDRGVGFVNAITDGHFSAFIPLLEVLPDHQGKGLGKTLVETMMARLENYYSIDLVCDDEVSGFYSKLGFKRTTGMSQRNRVRLLPDNQRNGE